MHSSEFIMRTSGRFVANEFNSFDNYGVINTVKIKARWAKTHDKIVTLAMGSRINVYISDKNLFIAKGQRFTLIETFKNGKWSVTDVHTNV